MRSKPRKRAEGGTMRKEGRNTVKGVITRRKYNKGKTSKE